MTTGGATGDDRGAATFHAQNEEGAAKIGGGAARVTTGDDTVAPWVTTGVPPGGATSQKDELEAVRAELLEQLKGENQFLRAALEQRDRDAAELRVALRKALEIAPRQLPIGAATENARPAATPPPEVATVGATEANLKTPPKVTADSGRKEPRPLWKVILGLR